MWLLPRFVSSTLDMIKAKIYVSIYRLSSKYTNISGLTFKCCQIIQILT